jgi:hypothetical protein
MGRVGDADKVLRIHEECGSIDDIFLCNRVHVVDEYSTWDHSIFDA